MENILVTLAEQAKALLHSNHSVAKQSRSPHVPTSNTLEDRQQMVSANKAMFVDIFGEEAPSWWGDFSTVKR